MMVDVDEYGNIVTNNTIYINEYGDIYSNNISEYGSHLFISLFTLMMANTINITNSISISLHKQISESISIAFGFIINKYFVKVFADNLNVVESRLSYITKSISTLININSSILKNINILKNNFIDITSYFLVNKLRLLVLSNNINISEVVRKSLTYNINSIINITTLISYTNYISLLINDIIGVGSLTVKKVSKSLHYVINVDGYTQQFITKIFVNIINIGTIFNAAKSIIYVILSDSLNVSMVTVNNVNKIITDITTITEHKIVYINKYIDNNINILLQSNTIQFAINIFITNNMSIYETMDKYLTKLLPYNIVISDNTLKVVYKSFSELIGITLIKFKFINNIINNTILLSETLIKYLQINKIDDIEIIDNRYSNVHKSFSYAINVSSTFGKYITKCIINAILIDSSFISKGRLVVKYIYGIAKGTYTKYGKVVFPEELIKR